MRFTSIFLAGAAAAIATAATQSADLSPAQQSIADCIDECEAGDAKCQSYCVSVPSPDEDQVNATTECVAACDQGDGSQAETDKYAACRDECIAGNYWKTGSGTPRETGASGSKASLSSAVEAASTALESVSSALESAASSAMASATGTDDASDSEDTASASATSSDADSSDDSSASETASGSAASATETDSGASVVFGGVSLAGLFAAILAL
ncbi:hypothetical protein FZEAL_7371 [Fusarium zealandicum]|uniref:Uncharacterized protein n=1 Tax=Fusarium zealandicum TaxID=1053134 RepID=A0A8H4UGR7_9HYPO|nr:hypothetical protein FZEAL_7371 [Fusarium zealandicum]